MRTLNPVIKTILTDPEARKALTEVMLNNKAMVKVGDIIIAAKKRLQEDLKVEVVCEPTVNELVESFKTSREHFDKAESIFWQLRIQNEELKVLNRELNFENELLREQNKKLKDDCGS